MSEDGLDADRAALHRARATGHRIVVEGVSWLVYEVSATDLDRRTSRSLVFESAESMRRVRDYPPDWRELSPAALIALSWSR